jgi:HAD superfamily hydrolase (TIGR01450 family)
LVERYDAVVCDLDGVVYRGTAAVANAVEVLARLPRPVVYATNNASRTHSEVAAHLSSLGLRATADDVVTSSMAGAQELARLVAPGSDVLAVGGPGVAAALRDAGLTPVAEFGRSVVAVLQGYGANVSAADLAEAAYAVEGGVTWVATNTDATLPTDRGTAPGNGALVAAVAAATGAGPALVVGKPHAPLYLLCASLLGTDPRRILAVGDRLDTDIAGAVAAGMDSLLVLTGVDNLISAALANPGDRPTWVSRDLSGLGRPLEKPRREGEWWVSGSDARLWPPSMKASTQVPCAATRFRRWCRLWATSRSSVDESRRAADPQRTR